MKKISYSLFFNYAFGENIDSSKLEAIMSFFEEFAIYSANSLKDFWKNKDKVKHGKDGIYVLFAKKYIVSIDIFAFAKSQPKIVELSDNVPPLRIYSDRGKLEEELFNGEIINIDINPDLFSLGILDLNSSHYKQTIMQPRLIYNKVFNDHDIFPYLYDATISNTISGFKPKTRDRLRLN